MDGRCNFTKECVHCKELSKKAWKEEREFEERYGGKLAWYRTKHFLIWFSAVILYMYIGMYIYSYYQTHQEALHNFYLNYLSYPVISTLVNLFWFFMIMGLPLGLVAWFAILCCSGGDKRKEFWMEFKKLKQV